MFNPSRLPSTSNLQPLIQLNSQWPANEPGEFYALVKKKLQVLERMEKGALPLNMEDFRNFQPNILVKWKTPVVSSAIKSLLAFSGLPCLVSLLFHHNISYSLRPLTAITIQTVDMSTLITAHGVKTAPGDRQRHNCFSSSLCY